jgi:hypothetical protein
MKTKKLPVGVSDFKDMVTGDYYYVDKTLLIKEIMDKGDKILLLPRPRRFGKTLNISMLRYFYDCCPETQPPVSETSSSPKRTTPGSNTYKKLFNSLAISRAGQQYLEHMGKYPVIFLTFKNIKKSDWESCLDKIMQLIQREYLRHDYLLNSPKLKSPEKDYFNKIVELKGNQNDYESSLENLLIFLNRYYGTRGVILIDEYDAPMHEGYHRGYYEEVINFMRNFLGSEEKELKPYWLNTSDNKMVESLLSKGGIELRKELEQLIRGESIEKAIEEKKYETELMDRGIKKIKKLAVVFSGKDVYVKESI